MYVHAFVYAHVFAGEQVSVHGVSVHVCVRVWAYVCADKHICLCLCMSLQIYLHASVSVQVHIGMCEHSCDGMSRGVNACASTGVPV